MTNKPYKEGTSLESIILDGWSRDFEISQTVREAKEMGFDVTEEYVRAEWNRHQGEYDAVH